MATMRKTSKGTVQASAWSNGIVLGMYGKKPVCSLEVVDGVLTLFINDHNVTESDIVIKHTDDKWNAKEE